MLGGVEGTAMPPSAPAVKDRSRSPKDPLRLVNAEAAEMTEMMSFMRIRVRERMMSNKSFVCTLTDTSPNFAPTAGSDGR